MTQNIATATRPDVFELDVSIIIVSFNTCELTTKCLQTIVDNTSGIKYEIIVVDNASDDGTIEKIRQDFPGVIVIEKRHNIGFARANNEALNVMRGEFALLLNPDTEIVGPAIGQAIDFLKAHPEVGVVGSQARWPDGRVQCNIFRYPRVRYLIVNSFVPSRLRQSLGLSARQRYGNYDLSKTQYVEAVAGCFMLVRREVVETVGGLDADFFLYGEEVEWCHRIRSAGLKVAYYPKSRIIHHLGGSSSKDPIRADLEMAKSLLIFFHKTRGPAIAYLAALILVLRELPRFVIAVLVSPFHSRSRRPETLKRAFHRLPHHLKWLSAPPWATK